MKPQQPPVRKIAWTDEEAVAMRHPLVRSKFRIAATAVLSGGVCVFCLVGAWNMMAPSAAPEAVASVRGGSPSAAVAPPTVLAVAPELAKAVAEAETPVVAALPPAPVVRTASAVVAPRERPVRNAAGAAEGIRRITSAEPGSIPAGLALGYASMPIRSSTPWSLALSSRIVAGEDVAGAVPDVPVPAAAKPVETASLDPEPEADEASEKRTDGKPAARTAKVVRTVSLRSRPGRGRVVGALKRGTKVAVHECDTWCRVTADGRTGWVYPRYIGIRR